MKLMRYHKKIAMKKIGLLLGLIIASLISALEPVIPSASSSPNHMIPIADKAPTLLVNRDRTIAAIDKDLNDIYAGLEQEYDAQLQKFKTSAQKKASPIKKLQKYSQATKECTDDLMLLIEAIGDKELTQYSKTLKSLTIKLFNAAEAINNNIELLNDEMYAIISDSVKKITTIEKELRNILALCERYRFTKNTQPELVRALERTIQYVHDMGKLIRKAAEKTVPKKNIFKRIFGT
jgi:hypothetical protein